MSPRTPAPALLRRALAAALLGIAAPLATAADAPPPAPPPPPPISAATAPATVIEVPSNEMELLLRLQKQSVVMRYEEYRALLAAAHVRTGVAQAAPPEDAVRLSGEGTLDLSDERAARFRIVYLVEGLAPGPRSLGFASGGVAFESVTIEPQGGAGPARYEEIDGVGRLHLDGPGVRRVTVTGSAVPGSAGAERRLDLWLPNPAAMALDVTLPRGVQATIAGEGGPITVTSPPERPLTVRVRPTRGGNLVLAWAPASQGTEGPGVLDANVKSLFVLGGGVVALKALVRVDVLRTPVSSVVLDLPADLSVHSVEGAGVTRSVRSEDRRRLTVHLEKPVLGTVEMLVQAERPLTAGPRTDLPRLRVEGALRHQGEAALILGSDVIARAVRVEGGRRIPTPAPPPPAPGTPPAPPPAPDPRTAGTLRYALFRGDASLQADLVPVALRVDAASTYYLNLAEPGQTVIATITYRVAEGALYRLRPRFPPGFDLRDLTVNGSPSGFTRDVAADGGVEIALVKGVPAGGEVAVLATLERARADWMPEKEHVTVEFPVPSAGATREEGYLAVGADAGFEVLDAGAKDLVSVGAADLTARGLSSAGLLYGYRLDGAQPRLTLDVVRREPLVEAEVVTVLEPGPRRADLAARAIYRIRRAGVRRLFLDVPSSAGDQVDFATDSFRSAVRLAGDRRPADVPDGYDRWQIDLDRRAIGTHVVTATWFLARQADDWSLPAAERVAARAPLERAERLLVVRRSAGLEVTLPSLAATPDVRTLDLAEMPAEAAVDPQGVLEVLRLPPSRDGVEVSVRKHAGAAVLDAIATEVLLRTAVAKEGILRTRADLSLVNVERQFVEAALPPRSSLIGAVVDGRPVKPLVDPRGVLLVTVPTRVGTAQASAPATRVVLTYETRLPGRARGGARIEEPVFPGLEVLHTTHEIGIEPDLSITSVGGDLATPDPVVRPARTPWILGLLSRVSRGASAGTMAPESSVVSAPASGPAPTGAGGAGGLAAPGGAVPPGQREPTDPSAAAPPPPPTTTPAPKPASERPEETPEMPGTAAAMAGDLPPSGTPRSPAENDSDLPSDDGGSRRAGAEDTDKERGAPGRGPARATKALLSLDVPVFLAPNRVVAARVGGGGTVEVAWVSDAAARRTYLLALTAATAALLLVVGTGWLPGWLAVLAGLLAAVIARLTLGAPASTFVAAAVDACTILAALLLARWLLGILARRFGPARRSPRAPVAPGAAALLLAALACTAAGTAAAEDAPAGPAPDAERDEAPAADPPAGTVFVPRDPAQGAALARDDRVFVPFAAWLDLQRQAFPERDPELAAKESLATLVEASYRAEVTGRSVRGSARLVYARRGSALRFARVPLPGLAVSEATLDGEPVRLLLAGDAYLVPLAREGDHVLELRFEAPVDVGPAGSSFTFGAPTSVVSRLEVSAAAFDGEIQVSGAGRVETLPSPTPGGLLARAWLGRPIGVGATQVVTVWLVERRVTALPATVRTRTESRVVHSVRDGGTESVLTADVHVLQGRAPFVDVALPSGVEVLEAGGPAVERWETAPDRLRLVLRAPTEGKVSVRVRAFRRADAPDRREAAPELAVLETTGESGLVVVNGDPAMRLEVEPGAGLFRTARPAEGDAAGPDGLGRVLGAWRFAARPAPLTIVATRGDPRLESTAVARVTFGDDRVRSVLDVQVRVQRAPVGEVAFALPGEDEIRAVEGKAVEAWWAEGEGDARRLLVRFADLLEGDRALTIRLARRLGGATAGLLVPRIALAGAQAERGTLFLFALPDVEPAPANVPGWKSLPPSRLEGQATDVPGARPTHAFAWDATPRSPLPVALRSPEREVEAVVVSQVSPSDEEQRLEHLVVFDVRRGATDRFSLFVPDGGLASNDLVRARDLRELRSERVTRKDADGVDVPGFLYGVRLQSVKSGLVEVTVSQLWPASTTIRVVRPEGVKAVRWFGLVRTFLDGEVDVRVGAGTPDEASWADLPFLPTGLERTSVLRAWAARAPYTLELSARRHRLEAQSDAVVLAAHAEVLLGLDGDARIRVRYRLFNRTRQFLRLRLPPGSVLYGAVAARRTVKPLAGTDGTVLLPVPKVPLGGTGYEVAVTYRAHAGDAWRGGGQATLPLPVVEGVEVDRTAITLRVPRGYAYDFDTGMTPATEREVLGGQVEATLRETQEVLKVAETGTLEQRLYACDNSVPLVQEAERQLLAWKAQGAPGDRVSALEADLDRLTRVQKEAQARCQTDAGVAQSTEAQFEAKATYGSNANGQTLVVLDDTEAGSGGGAGGGEAGTASWRLNYERIPAETGVKKDLAELRGRMAAQFLGRATEDRAKGVDVAREQLRLEALSVTRAGGKAGPQQAAPDPDTLRFDENRNNLWLNERLRVVQEAHGQLGATETTAATPTGRPPPRGGRVVVEEAIDRYDGRRDALWAQGAGAAATRAGLFGVDVPLPRDGLVYWFVGVRTGSPVTLDASPVTTSGGVRILSAFALWGALAAGVVALRRRLAARRA